MTDYKYDVLTNEPTAKASGHHCGSAEWVSVRRAPYTEADEIAYVIDGNEEDGWKAAYAKLFNVEISIPNRTGPGGYEYPTI